MPKAEVDDPVLAGCLRAGREADVYALLGSRVDGLTAAEACLRLAEHGPNTLTQPSRPALTRRFLANFAHLMAILLWLGGAVAWLARLPDLAIAIRAVVIINGLFSFRQEYKAERATEALLQYLPRQARVMRQGRERGVSAEDLVPGDLLLLREGEHISADGLLVQVNELRKVSPQSQGQGKSVSQIPWPEECVLAAVIRQGSLIVPRGPTLLESGDEVLAVVHADQAASFAELLGPRQD